MQMKNKLKEERASMAVYVFIVLFGFLMILSSIYAASISTRKEQLKTIIKIKESYEMINKDMEKVYQEQSNKIDKDDVVGFGDVSSFPNKLLNEKINGEIDEASNIFNFSNGARVTYVTNTYSASGSSINGGYTGSTSPVGNTTDGFWITNNSWGIQGCLENDDSIENILYNHLETSKSASSSTCMSGSNTDKKIIIIDPRAFYGDTLSNVFEIDELYLASANSDGNVGKYTIYISNSNIDVSTKPDDSSWSLLTTGQLTTDGQCVKVYDGNIKFRYIKLEVYSRDKSYMELAAIKGFKKYTTGNDIKLAAKQYNNYINIMCGCGDIALDKLTIETPSNTIIEKNINKLKNYRLTYKLTEKGIYKIKAISLDDSVTKEIIVTISELPESEFEYVGNLFNYNTGARVTYVTNTYAASGSSINGGYTGNTSPVGNTTDDFWTTRNSWGIQGCLENDDNKTDISKTNQNTSKNSSSSTCMNGIDEKTIIITPRAYQGDTLEYIFKAKEIYLASANSDGDVGKYEIYISDKYKDLSTEPNEESWQLLTSGELTEDGKLIKVYDGDVQFKFLKLKVWSRTKSYMELAAIKIF